MAIACDCRNGPGRIDFTDPVIERISDVDVTCRIDRNAFRTVQGGLVRWATVSTKTSDADPGERRDPARCIHFPDAVIRPFRNVDVPCGVDSNAERIVQLS